MDLDGSGLGMGPYTMDLDGSGLGMGPYVMKLGMVWSETTQCNRIGL